MVLNLQSQVNTLQTNFNNFQTEVNNRFDQVGLRINDVEQNMLYMRQQLQGQIDTINAELATRFKKATPMSGYNPYNLGGNISAQVWMYDITLIEDSNIRFYYVQFNNISGTPPNGTNWMPLPRTFGHFMYTYHPDYFAITTPSQTIPAAYSGINASYTLTVSTNEDAIRLWCNAGPSLINNDYIGFILVGNASTPGPTEQDIENMKPEELVKLTKELAFKVKQLDTHQQKVDKEKLKRDVLEQMKRLGDYDFIPVQSPQQKITQTASTTKK
jgi:hypothetical protein